MSDALNELLSIANAKDFREVGGSHNQKGVDYQRHWAIMRMFELEQEEEDFLILFEAIQDVAILDSSTAPTAICIYQVKKKERAEWDWRDLTGLNKPGNKKPKPLEVVKESPLGKLYAAVRAVKALQSSGRFVSNAGCDLPLFDGTNAATSLPTALSTLSSAHLDILVEALETIHNAGEPLPDLSRLHVERVDLPANSSGTHLVGFVHQFLVAHIPGHAGQAQALVDSLAGVIGPLGAKTDICKTFEEMKKERGYSRGEFREALARLKTVPDIAVHLETWLSRLGQEGMLPFETMAIHLAIAGILRRKVEGMGDDALSKACDEWLASQPDNPVNLKPFFEAGYEELKLAFPTIRKPEIFGVLLIKAIKKCADQILEN